MPGNMAKNTGDTTQETSDTQASQEDNSSNSTNSLLHDELLKLQAKYRTSITRAYNKARTGQTYNFQEITAVFLSLQEVEEQLYETLDEDIEDRINSYVEKMTFIQAQQKLETETGTQPTTNLQPKPKIMLKAEKPPTFDGNYQKWAIFKRIFTTLVHNNIDFTDEDRERYLLNACSGEAEQLILAFAGKHDAYNRMMNTLKKHYEDIDKIKEKILKNIRSLPEISDRFDERVEEFKNQAQIIISLVEAMTSTTDDFRKTVTKELISRWNIKLQLDFLRKHSKLSDVLKVLQQFYNERENLISFDRLKTSSSKSTSGAVNSKPTQCDFCDESHRNYQCKSNITSQERLRIAQQNRLCFRCLNSGHRSIDCRFNKSCDNCHRRHHTLLCMNPNGGTPQHPPTVQDQIQNVTTGVAFAQVKDTNSPIININYNGHTMNVLLDTGCDLTLIKRRNVVPSEIRKGIPRMFDGIGGLNPSEEVVSLRLNTDRFTSIEFMAYVLEYLPGNLDMIIGKDQLNKVMKPEALSTDKRCYFNTIFGVVKFGCQKDVDRYVAACLTICEPETTNNIDQENLQRSFDKLVSADLDYINEIQECKFDIQQREDGRYEASLPFINEQLPKNNFNLAYRRLLSTQCRLEKSNNLKDYETQLDQYVKDGHAVSINVSSPSTEFASYLPHHAVLKIDRETTKMRIVFDGSAGSPSLNDILHKGWNDSLNLIDRLVDFRTNSVALIADIEKAFLQIKIKEKDQDWLRYLWKRNNRLELFKMTSLPFGLVCSPTILMNTLYKQAQRFRDIYPFTAKLLSQSFYMDDFITSLDSPEETLKVKTEANIILSQAGFNLCKWKTNHPDLFKNFNMTQEESNVKVLGIRWLLPDDQISIKLAIQPVPSLTKRNVLKQTNSIFDPIGIIEPVRLKMKLLLQQIWSIKLDWDEPLPNFITKEYNIIFGQLSLINDIRIPRHLFPTKPIQVNVFSDASKKGLGYCLFVTLINGQNIFVQGKSRVAPARSTPDLELAALTEAVETIPYFAKKFDLPFVVWCDSEITLKRLNMSVNKCGTYVNNRLTRIHSVCQTIPVQFYYIRTEDNPADAFSRPLLAEEFFEKLPYQCHLNLQSLTKENPCFPTPIYNVNAVINAKPEKKVIDLPDELKLFEDCSEWGRLVIRVRFVLTAVQRFKTNSDNWKTIRATVDDSINYIFKEIQQANIEELSNLTVPYFVDDKQVLRIKTRDSNQTLIWIPKHSRVAIMLVRVAHLKGLHCGKRFTKAIVKLHYYIPGLDSLAYKVRKECVYCQKRFKSLMNQPVGMLPDFRTRLYEPFQCVGIDMFGPIKLNNRRTELLCLIYTCAVSRAIDIEILDDAKGPTCLRALNFLFLRHGVPDVIISDNGSNFTRNERDLKRLFMALREHSQSDHNTMNIKWYFIPPHSPWWGGLYERMIGTVKRCVPKMCNCKNKDELRYILQEAIAVVNSRPLFEDDDLIVTPAHYLINRSLLSLPSGYGAGSIDGIKAYRKIKQARNRFLKLWKPLYLQSLAFQGLKANHKPQVIKVDDPVLVQEPGIKREDWNLARVTEVIPGPDNLVRSVKVVYAKDSVKGLTKKTGWQPKEFVRSVQNLVRLELSDDSPRPECVATDI